MKLRKRLAAVLLAAAGLISAAATAQGQGSRPIRMIIPLGVGGSLDVVGRILAPHLSVIMGQQFVVDNRPGGAGLPAYELVAKAQPDGHTLIFAASNLAANPILFRKLPYDTEKDFAPVSLVVIIPSVLVVHPSLPVSNLQDLIRMAKAKPGSLNFGSVGNGSGPHLTMEVFNNALGIKAEHVPYKGAAAVMTDMIGGRLSYMFATVTSAHPHITRGAVKALGVSSARRTPALPDVPAIAESAIPGFDVNVWLGLLAPARTPPHVVNRLNAAMAKALQDPKVQEQLKVLGASAVGGTPEQFRVHLKNELARWAKLAQTVKFEVAN